MESSRVCGLRPVQWASTPQTASSGRSQFAQDLADDVAEVQHHAAALPPVVEETMNTRGDGLRKGKPVATAVATMPAGSTAARTTRVTCSITRSMLSTRARRPRGRRPWVWALRGML